MLFSHIAPAPLCAAAARASRLHGWRATPRRNDAAEGDMAAKHMHTHAERLPFASRIRAGQRR